MKKDPKRLDAVLSMWTKTTDLFSKFGHPTLISATPFQLGYEYDVLHLKDFMSVSIKHNGKQSNYSIGFFVRRCNYQDKECQIKRKEIVNGILMSDFKKDYYKKLLYGTTEDSIVKDMLDVGQGDGIFFQMPDGSNVLIDGGSSSRKGVGEYVLVPALKYYGAAALDYVIITHMDEDHISGIKEMLEQGYPVKHLILANIDQSDEDIKAFYKLAKQNKMIVRDMKRGEQLTFGKVTMCCLHPFEGFPTEDKNAASLVIYLKYGNFDGLFTGDLDQTGEEAVCNYVEEKKEIFSELTSGLEVLKVAHHGSAYSTDRDFLKLFCPKTALISVGKKNRYGHPHQELMQRLEEADCEIFQTRYSGAVEIKTDGNTWEIQYERN